eukprot:IDg16899t1
MDAFKKKGNAEKRMSEIGGRSKLRRTKMQCDPKRRALTATIRKTDMAWAELDLERLVLERESIECDVKHCDE